MVSNAKLLELPALAGKKDLIAQAKNAEAGSGDDLLARRQLVDSLLAEHVKPYTSGWPTKPSSSTAKATGPRWPRT